MSSELIASNSETASKPSRFGRIIHRLFPEIVELSHREKLGPEGRILEDANAAIAVVRDNRLRGGTKIMMGLKEPIPGFYHDGWVSPRMSKQRLLRETGVGVDNIVGALDSPFIAFAQGITVKGRHAIREDGEPDLFLVGIADNVREIEQAIPLNHDALESLSTEDMSTLELVASTLREQASARPLPIK